VANRRALLTVTLIFITGLSALTVFDLIRSGVNALNVLSILILALFWVGIVGALRAPTRR
jgi:hypothetical protein